MVRLVDLQKKHDIKVLAWAPLAPIWRAPDGPVDPVVKRIASEKGVTESQVLLAWAARYTKGGVVTLVFPYHLFTSMSDFTGHLDKRIDRESSLSRCE
jgi:diketogulonate reductase-like aldo/keto reductase